MGCLEGGGITGGIVGSFYLMRAGSVVNRNFCNLLPNGER